MAASLKKIKTFCISASKREAEAFTEAAKNINKNKDGSRSFAQKKGHRTDRWMCALARITRVDKSQLRMRVSAPLPTANAIMEMRGADQHT